MIRVLFAYTLALVLTVTSFALSQARGSNPDIGNGIEMVICTGVGMTTLTIGPDGDPIESVHLCPDGAQIFAAEFMVPIVSQPEERFVSRIVATFATPHDGRNELAPSARGPPAFI